MKFHLFFASTLLYLTGYMVVSVEMVNALMRERESDSRLYNSTTCGFAGQETLSKSCGLSILETLRICQVTQFSVSERREKVKGHFRVFLDFTKTSTTSTLHSPGSCHSQWWCRACERWWGPCTLGTCPVWSAGWGRRFWKSEGGGGLRGWRQQPGQGVYLTPNKGPSQLR